MSVAREALKQHLWLLAAIVTCFVIQAYPDLMRAGIDPYDGSLFAANGALFLRAAQEISQFLAHPIDWLYAYYNQYPALAVRRHPPLFGVLEAIVFAFTGVAVFGAKLTNLLHGIVLVAGVYALSYRLGGDRWLAAATAFVVAMTPQTIWLSTAVRLDVPSLAFAVWALFHYINYLRTGLRNAAVWFAILSVLSLYTYQLTVFIIAGACLHLLFARGIGVLRDRTVWIAATILAIFLIPLGIEQLYVAADNFIAAAGGEIEEWKRFHPIADRMSVEFFLYYPQAWLATYPLQSLGLLVWSVLAFRRGLKSEEALLFIGVLGALAFFSWARGKDPRYAVYMMVPIVYLSVRSLWQLLVGSSDPGRVTPLRRTVALGIIGVAAVVQSLSVTSPNSYLTGMDTAAREILMHVEQPRILYTGPRDGAFVFQIRAHDTERRSRVFRATVQAKSAAEITEFIRKERINVIAWEEGDQRSGEDGMAEFRKAMDGFIREAGDFESLGEFTLVFKGPNLEKEFRMPVFRRKAE